MTNLIKNLQACIIIMKKAFEAAKLADVILDVGSIKIFFGREWIKVLSLQNIKIPFRPFNYILFCYSGSFTGKSIHSLLQLLVGKHIDIKTARKYVKLLHLMTDVGIRTEVLPLTLPGPVEIDESCI